MGAHAPFVRCSDNYNPQTPSKCTSSLPPSPPPLPPLTLKATTQLDMLVTVDFTQLVLPEHMELTDMDWPPQLWLMDTLDTPLPQSPLPQPSLPQPSLPQLQLDTLSQLHVLLEKPQSSKRSSNQ